MGLISLGSHTFVRNPGKMTPLEKDKINAHVKTYSSVSHFSWGLEIVGKVIELDWNYMEADEFTILQGIYEDDETVVLNPNDGSAKTYNVELLNLTSRYYMGRGVTFNDKRLDIKLTLLITAEN
jgi:hypothetical protein